MLPTKLECAPRLHGTNCAILPEYVQTHIDFVAAQHVRIIQIDNREEKKEIQIIDFADAMEDGNLKWWGENQLNYHNSVNSSSSYHIVEKPGVNKYGFASSIKASIIHQLELQKVKLMEQTLNPMIDVYAENHVPMPICNWLSAYAAVKTNSKEEKEKFMLSYVRNEPNVFLQAGLLQQLGLQGTDKLLSSDDKAYYRQRFLKALESGNFEHNKFDIKSLILKLGITQMRE
jgi:hypothetical protein